MDTRQRCRIFLQMIGMVINVVIGAVISFARPLYVKEDYHTSALSGAAWVLELLEGHPNRIRCELGMSKHVFRFLVSYLQVIGINHSRGITLEEQLAIFLYRCVTGLSVRHTAERFQRSNATISKYFLKMLDIFSSKPFYSDFVHGPRSTDPHSPYIFSNKRFYPFFENAIGAMDGTHFLSSASAEEQAIARDRNGLVTQNCLAACDFDYNFTYISSGWEGSVSDSTMFLNSRTTDLKVQPGKYYLADAGFPLDSTLLIPYRGVRYHLAEWGHADLRPTTPQELFNLRHASARNIIERLFGILKNRFAILQHNPRLAPKVQARLPAALAALHNVIRKYDSEEIESCIMELDVPDYDLEELDPELEEDTGGELAKGPPRRTEKKDVERRRNDIANQMWIQYQQVLQDI